MLNAIDTHAHLDDVENVDEALKEADQAGVVGVVAVGIDHSSNQKNLEIKKKTSKPKIYLALGIHPESLEDKSPDQFDGAIHFIRENIKEAVAVGEIGLDYWYKWAKKSEEKKAEQREIFLKQLELAKEFHLPVIIHSRGSWADCLKMAQETGIKKAVFHWYSGPVDTLEQILSCGYFISAGPALSYSPPLQIAVKHAPMDQMLIETDSPVYYKEGESGFRAGPKDVLRTLKLYAAQMNMDEEEAAEIFLKNSKNFFAIS